MTHEESEREEIYASVFFLPSVHGHDMTRQRQHQNRYRSLTRHRLAGIGKLRPEMGRAQDYIRRNCRPSAM